MCTISKEHAGRGTRTERVEREELSDTCNGTSGELGVEGQGCGEAKVPVSDQKASHQTAFALCFAHASAWTRSGWPSWVEAEGGRAAVVRGVGGRTRRKVWKRGKTTRGPGVVTNRQLFGLSVISLTVCASLVVSDLSLSIRPYLVLPLLCFCLCSTPSYRRSHAAQCTLPHAPSFLCGHD